MGVAPGCLVPGHRGVLICCVRAEKGGSWGHGLWVACFTYERHADGGEGWSLQELPSPGKGSLSWVRFQRAEHEEYRKSGNIVNAPSPTLVSAAETSLSCIFIYPAATWLHHFYASGHFRIHLPKVKCPSASKPGPPSLRHLRKHYLQK